MHQFSNCFDQVNESFKKTLIKVGFTDEKQFKQALLNSADEIRLVGMREELILRETQTNALLDDAGKWLEIEQDKKLTVVKLSGGLSTLKIVH